VLDAQLRALARQREHVVRVGADQAEREVEVAEDRRRVDRDVALGVDRGAEVLQRKGGRGRVFGARGRRRKGEEDREGEGVPHATRTTRRRRSFTRLFDRALQLLERIVVQAVVLRRLLCGRARGRRD